MEQETEVPSTRRLVFTRAPEEIGDHDANRQAPDPQGPKVNEVAVMAAEPGNSTGNIDDMSVEELKRRQEEIDQKIRDKQAAEKKAVIEQIVDVVHTYNIPIDELVDALGGLKIKRKGVKALQKFQDPVTGATWSGRGKEPLWIRGKDRNKFLIP